MSAQPAQADGGHHDCAKPTGPVTVWRVIEWTPGRWWIVDHDDRPSHGYTPIAGPFASEDGAKNCYTKMTALRDALAYLTPVFKEWFQAEMKERKWSFAPHPDAKVIAAGITNAEAALKAAGWEA